MTATATEKAAPIPAEVWALARGEAENFKQAALQFREYEGDLADDIRDAIAYAIMQDRADRASQEERAREDEREACAKVAEGWLQSSWQDEVFAARSIADAIRLRGAS